jgi:hypothetical protein
MAGSLLALVIGAVMLAGTVRWLRPDPNPRDKDDQINQPLSFVVLLFIGSGFLLLGLAGIVYVLVTGDAEP